MAKDYYATLGVSRSANADEIKAAYKKLAKQHHPDLNKGNKASEDRFKELNEAYRVLGDEKKRSFYDRHGADEQTQNQGGATHSGYEGFDGFDVNFNDIFSEFFGGGFGRSRQSNRGEDVNIELTITLEEAAKGKKQKVALDLQTACTSCKGTGAEGGKRVTCPECKGQGQVRRTQRTPFGVFQTAAVCEHCRGLRSVPEHPCKKCRGAGRVEQEQEVHFEIPAGISDRMQMRVPGKGHAGAPGQAPGDLLVAVFVEEHELFTREGDDLHLASTITYPQAVLGAELEVPTLTGSVTLAIPAGTESHTTFRVRNKGMPKLRGGIGDLLVTVKLGVPKNISKEERALIEKLAGVEKPKGFFERLRL